MSANSRAWISTSMRHVPTPGLNTVGHVTRNVMTVEPRTNVQRKGADVKSWKLGIALTLAAFPQLLMAQAYPVKPIRMIVPYPPGGGTDTAARLIGQKLTESLGRTVIVENRAGANGLIGTEAMAKAVSDGYTVGMATPGPVTVGRSLYPNLAYDPERDLVPVILVNASPNVLAVHPSVPARSVKELIALARARPLRAGVSTIASIQHLLAEMLNRAARSEEHTSELQSQSNLVRRLLL